MEAEEWKPVAGYEGKYLVSNHGRVKSFKFKKERILVNRLNHSGYEYCDLYKKCEAERFFNHVLVAMHFIGDRISPVNHKDGNKRNNHISNLEYVTVRENRNHDLMIKKQGKCLRGVSKGRIRSDGTCRYRAHIEINGKYVHLGMYEKEIDAHIAYLNKIEFLGERKYADKYIQREFINPRRDQD